MGKLWPILVLLMAACSQPTPREEPQTVVPVHLVSLEDEGSYAAAQDADPDRSSFPEDVPPGAQMEKRRRDVPMGLARQVNLLYVEQRFRWQARAMNDAFKRDRQWRYQGFFLDAQDGWTQPTSQYSEEIKRSVHPLQYPFSFKGAAVETREQFLATTYDVIVVGDLNPEDKRLPENYWAWIEEWVRGGGGLILAAGQNHHPSAYLDNDSYRALHPFDLKVAEGEVDTSERKFWGLTQEGAKHSICRLSEDDNAALWGGEDDSGFKRGSLSGLYYYAQAGDPMPGTILLARVVREGEPIGSGAPLLAVREHGRGRVVWVGTDDTHYWREFAGDQYFYRFWKNAIAWAAIAEP
jgi:hypothetical protein